MQIRLPIYISAALVPFLATSLVATSLMAANAADSATTSSTSQPAATTSGTPPSAASTSPEAASSSAATSASAPGAATAANESIDSASDLVIHDPSRNKDLHLRVTYPTARQAHAFPVIVFSHGAGGSKDSYRYLVTYWAKHGYVVIQPTHADSVDHPSGGREGFRAFMEKVEKVPTDYAGWDDRERDIKFVIDSLPAIQKQIPATMDTTKLGLGGHSYGAFTTTITAGAAVPAAGASAMHSPKDSRIKAILPISPQGVRTRSEDFGFDDQNAWRKIEVPAMYMTGTLDQTTWTKAADRKAAFAGSPAGDKYFVVVNGANHMTFSGGVHLAESASANPGAERPLVNRAESAPGSAASSASGSMHEGLRQMLSEHFGPPESGDHEKMLDAVKVATTTFWDAYLKNNAQAKQRLKDGTIKSSNDLISIESK